MYKNYIQEDKLQNIIQSVNVYYAEWLKILSASMDECILMYLWLSLPFGAENWIYLTLIRGLKVKNSLYFVKNTVKK